MARSLREKAEATVGGLGVLGALFLGARSLIDEGKALLTTVDGVPRAAILYLLAAVVVLMAGLWLLFKGLSAKSRLRDPDALDIDPDKPEHLRGRQDDIRRLAQAVATRPLVFLEGESGCGKSALIRSGLIPEIRRSRSEPGPLPSMLPIYVNSYADDWDQGVRDRLADAAWHWFDEGIREQLGIANRDDLRSRLLPGAGRTGLLKRIRNELGVIPLLIFDQFDDYQIAHRDRFLREGRWIDADELAAENRTWQRIRDAVGRDLLHLLFVTRRDLRAALDAVSFGPYQTYALDRVERGSMQALLEQLVAPRADGSLVIENPKAGWESLEQRLLQDLSDRDRVLPIQARIVFKGLGKLRYLTTAAYERQGRVEGLEAAHIEGAVRSAANVSGIPESRVLAALLALVDDTDSERPKVQTADAPELAATAGTIPERADTMLAALEHVGVIRRRVGDQGEATRGAWSLYHDYLARSVLAAHRRADFWQRLLKDRQRSLQSSADLRGRWRALLSPWEQLRLLWQTMRGRVRWAGYRGLLLRSSLRFLPIVVAGGTAGVLVAHNHTFQTLREAERIAVALQTRDYYQNETDNQYERLWALASSSISVKKAFLEFTRANYSDDWLYERSSIEQSLVGLDPDMKFRSWIISNVDIADSPLSPKAWLAERILVTSPEIAPGRWRHRKGLVQWLRPGSRNGYRDIELVRGVLSDLAAGPSLSHDDSLIVPLFYCMTTTRYLDTIARCGLNLASLSPILSPTTIDAAVKILRDILERSNDLMVVCWTGYALAVLLGELPPDDADKVVSQLLEGITASTSYKDSSYVVGTVVKVNPRLDAQARRRLVATVLQRMSEAKEPFQLGMFGTALGELGYAACDDQGKSVLPLVLNRAETTVDPTVLPDLAPAIAALAPCLSAPEANAIFSSASANLKSEPDGPSIGPLIHLAAALARQLPSEAVEDLASFLIETMIEPFVKDGVWLGAWVKMYRDDLTHLLECLDAGERRAFAAHWIGELNNESRLLYAGTSVAVLAPMLSSQQTEGLALRLVTAISSTHDATTFAEISAALGNLSIGVDAKAVDTMIDLLQAPLAYGETRDHLLRYYGRRAGVEIKTADDLVAWARIHRPVLDLNRPPHNPFASHPVVLPDKPTTEKPYAIIQLPSSN